MKIDLHKFYQYIFGDWADISSHIKEDLDEVSKEKVKLKRKKEIIEFFFGPDEKKATEILSEEDKPLISEANRLHFRAALRAIKNPHPLELILFENKTEELKKYSFPDDKEIGIIFNNYEQECGHFSANKETLAAAALKFNKYFKICKLIGDFVENNNDINNSVALLHAYKLLAIFGDEANFYKYLKAFNFFKSKYPIHDALMPYLPIHDDALYLPEWRKIIFNIGPQAFKLLGMATEIGRHLKRAPKNYAEAFATAKNIQYKNAKEYPLLADLCFQYNLSEKEFEKCLAIEKHRKLNDNLPNVVINGAEMRESGYYLMKLPINDPRAYLLGHLTNCCQSIGGHSQKCVIDGIIRPNNGFYVLIKENKATEKKSTSNFPFDEKNNIDYSRAEIVGQGYAWLSKQRNLVFDSWENKTPERDDAVIVPMLEKFSQLVTHDNNFDILRITIGIGGKTPELLKNNMTNIPEIILEGHQYGDSANQSVIYCNEEKRKKLITDLEAAFTTILSSLNPPKNKLRDLLNWVTQPCYSNDYYKRTKAALELKETQLLLKEMIHQVDFETVKKEKIQWEGIIDIYEKLFKLPINENDPTLIAYLQLKKINLETNLIYLSLLTHPNEVIAIFDKIKSMQLENDFDLCKHVLAKRELFYATVFLNGFSMLQKMKLDKDPSIRKTIFEIKTDPIYLALAMEELQKKQLDKEPLLCNWIFHSPRGFQANLDYVDSTVEQFYINAFNKINELKLDKDEAICRCIEKNPQSAMVLLDSFEILQTCGLEKDPVIRTWIFENSDIADSMTQEYLRLIDLKLADDLEITQQITKHPNHITEIVTTFSLLKEMKLEQDPDIRKKIFALPAYLIYDTFGWLAKNKISLNHDIINHIVNMKPENFKPDTLKHLIEESRRSGNMRFFSNTEPSKTESTAPSLDDKKNIP